MHEMLPTAIANFSPPPLRGIQSSYHKTILACSTASANLSHVQLFLAYINEHMDIILYIYI